MLATLTKTKAFGNFWDTLIRFNDPGPIQITLKNDGPDPVHVQINRIINGVTTPLALVGASPTIMILPGDKFIKPLYDSPYMTLVKCRASSARATVITSSLGIPVATLVVTAIPRRSARPLRPTSCDDAVLSRSARYC